MQLLIGAQHNRTKCRRNRFYKKREHFVNRCALLRQKKNRENNKQTNHHGRLNSVKPGKTPETKDRSFTFPLRSVGPIIGLKIPCKAQSTSPKLGKACY